MSNFFSRLFGKRESREATPSVENIVYEEVPIESIRLAQNSFPPGTRTAKIESSEFPVASNLEDFVQFVSAYRSCVLLISTRDYKQVMLNLDNLFSTKFGKQSDFYSALMSGVVICSGCGKELNKLLLSLSQAQLAEKSQPIKDFVQMGKCPTCGNVQSIFFYDNVEVTSADLDALRVYLRHLAKEWWKKGYEKANCSRCSTKILQGNGFVDSNESIFWCKKCFDEALPEIQKKPNYLGAGEIRRARNLVLSYQQKGF